MAVLIFGRVVQGIGAAGLVSIPVVVLGDVAAPKERGKYSAYFAVVYTTAGACGPALGGFLSDHAALVGDLLAQHPARAPGAVWSPRRCCGACRATSARTGST